MRRVVVEALNQPSAAERRRGRRRATRARGSGRRAGRPARGYRTWFRSREGGHEILTSADSKIVSSIQFPVLPILLFRTRPRAFAALKADELSLGQARSITCRSRMIAQKAAQLNSAEPTGQRGQRRARCSRATAYLVAMRDPPRFRPPPNTVAGFAFILRGSGPPDKPDAPAARCGAESRNKSAGAGDKPDDGS